MDSSVDPLAAMQTKIVEWPRDLKEIESLIKRAESQVKNLSIDIATAESEYFLSKCCAPS
ncbi:hypothetical protein H1R20_g2474, partial [Candolleomyces eurysporus]